MMTFFRFFSAVLLISAAASFSYAQQAPVEENQPPLVPRISKKKISSHALAGPSSAGADQGRLVAMNQAVLRTQIEQALINKKMATLRNIADFRKRLEEVEKTPVPEDEDGEF